jgi:hypothetical protein
MSQAEVSSVTITTASLYYSIKHEQYQYLATRSIMSHVSEKITAIQELILDPDVSDVKATKVLEGIFASLQVDNKKLFAQMPVDYIYSSYNRRRDQVEHQAYLLGGFNGNSGDQPIHTPFHAESDPLEVHGLAFLPNRIMRFDLTTLASHNVRVGVNMSRQPMIDAGRLLLSLTMTNSNIAQQ